VAAGFAVVGVVAEDASVVDGAANVVGVTPALEGADVVLGDGAAVDGAVVVVVATSGAPVVGTVVPTDTFSEDEEWEPPELHAASTTTAPMRRRFIGVCTPTSGDRILSNRRVSA
jgi:hypothetical protein